MRKDVKIGLAIAGVLFAVLLVYLWVPKGDKQVASNGGEHPVDGSIEGAIPEGAEPPADPGTAPVPSVPQDITDKPGPDAFAPNAPADPGATTADAGSAGGRTDWLKSFETDQVVVESHPGLVALTKTPSAADASADRSVAGADPDHAAGSPGGAARELVALNEGHLTGIPAVNDSPSARSTGTGVSLDSPAGGRGAVESPISPTGSRGTVTLGGGTGRTHVMQRGETFSSVAKAVYGKGSYYLQIQKANPTLNPNSLKPGTLINLPEISATASSSAPASPAASSSGNGTSRGGATATPERSVNSASEYRIAPGDSLYKISMKLYGNGAEVDDLYEMNKATIGEDKARLKVGTVLKLHQAPRTGAAR